MANTITNFLVGVGFDYDNRGAEEVGSGIDSIKSKALQLGAVVAGAFGIKALTADFAAAKDTLGKFAETFGVTADDVQALGNALASEGGTLESFMGQLESIERLRAGLLAGDAGFIAIAGKAGIDTTDLIEATTATEAFLSLADQFQGLTQQQRLNAASSLGLDSASIRLLSKGREVVESIVAKFRDIRPVSEDMTEDAAEFNRQILEATQNVGSLADAFSAGLLPVITEVVDTFNNFFDENRNPIIKVVTSIADVVTSSGDPKEISENLGVPEFFTKDVGIFSDDEDTLINDFKQSDIVKDAVSVFNAVFNTDQPVGGINFNRPITDTQQVRESTPDAPQRAQQMTEQTINVKLELDGDTLDNRTIKVLNGQAQTAIDDITSSTGG